MTSPRDKLLWSWSHIHNYSVVTSRKDLRKIRLVTLRLVLGLMECIHCGQPVLAEGNYHISSQGRQQQQCSGKHPFLQQIAPNCKKCMERKHNWATCHSQLVASTYRFPTHLYDCSPLESLCMWMQTACLVMISWIRNCYMYTIHASTSEFSKLDLTIYAQATRGDDLLWQDKPAADHKPCLGLWTGIENPSPVCMIFWLPRVRAWVIVWVSHRIQSWHLL